MAVSIGELRGQLTLDDKFSGSLKKSSGALTKFAKQGAIVAGAIGAAGIALGKALSAQAVQVEAVNKLNIALANQGNFSEEASKNLQSYASSLQQVTTAGDESIIGLQASLASFGQNEEVIKRTTAAALDWAATGVDLKAVGDLLGRAYVGQTQSLTRYGIVIKEGLGPAEKFEAVLEQLEQRFGGQAQAQAQNFTGQMQQLSNAFGDTLESVGKLVEFLATDLGAGIGSVTSGFEALTSFIGGDLIIVISELRAGFSLAIATITLKLAELFQFLSKLPDRLGGGKFQEYAIILTDVADDQAEFAEQLRETGNQAVSSVGKLVDVTNQTVDTGKASAEAAAQVAKLREEFGATLREVIADSNKVGLVFDELPQRVEKTRFALGNASFAAFELGDSLARTAAEGGASIDTIRTKLEGMGLSAEDVENIIGRLPDSFKDAEESAKSFGDTFLDGVESTLDELPATIVGAIQGGGDVFRSIGAKVGGDIGAGLGNALSDAIGGRLGSLVGGFAGPLGALAGGAIGGLVDQVTGFFRSAEEEVNDLRDAFFETQGGFENLAARVGQITDQDLVKQIFDAQTVDEFNMAVDQTLSLMDTQAQAQQALQEATERYGFTIEELGPAMQRQMLSEQAQQLFQDFQLLTASGIDVNTVIERMGPSLVEFAETAKKTGQAVPEAMRPILDQLAAQGKLVDENGQAFGSAEEAGITFAQSLDEQFSTLIDRIDEFITALTGIEPDPIVIPVQFDVPRGGPNIPEGVGIPGFQHGGIVTSPTVAMVGEGGQPEAIVPLNQASQVNAPPAQAEFSADQMAQLARTVTKAFRDSMLQTAGSSA